MVDINVPNNQSVSISTPQAGRITASTSNGNIGANTNADAQLAYSWAVGVGLIQGIDYSSKYYAGQSANSASEATSAVEGFTTTVTEATQQAISTLETTKTTIITELGEEKTSIISDIDNEGSTQTSEITSTGGSYLTEIETLGTTQISDITSTATTCITDIQSEGSTQVASVTTTGETYITNIQTEGSTQVTNITTTATTYITEMTTLKEDTQGYATTAVTSATNAALSEDNAEIWAEGTDEEVQELGGTHSSKRWSEISASGQIQSDWTETDSSAKSFILHKPTIPTDTSDLTNNAGFIPNTATGFNSITIYGTAASQPQSINIGNSSSAGQLGVAIGHMSYSSDYGTAIGRNATASQKSCSFGYNSYCRSANAITIGAKSVVGFSSPRAIQIGEGTNSTANSLAIGFGNDANDNPLEYQLLDGVTGLIPDARISSNIARTSNTLPSSTKYGADLSYSSNTLQLLDQDGNGLGTSVTIQSSPDIDGKSITTNISDELQTVGVIDQNNTTNAIKTWTGTKAQYDAIVTKDSTTLYNIIDDSDVTLSLLELLYPVGSIYIGTMATCPLATLGVGTWQIVAVDRVLQGATDGSVVGNTVQAGLPNITGSVKGVVDGNDIGWRTNTGAFTLPTAESKNNSSTSNYNRTLPYTLQFNASSSNSIYGNSNTVQPPAYLVNIWERIS